MHFNKSATQLHGRSVGRSITVIAAAQAAAAAEDLEDEQYWKAADVKRRPRPAMQRRTGIIELAVVPNDRTEPAQASSRGSNRWQRPVGGAADSSSFICRLLLAGRSVCSATVTIESYS